MIPKSDGHRKLVMLSDLGAARAVAKKSSLVDVSITLTKAGLPLPLPLVDQVNYVQQAKNAALIGIDPSLAVLAARAGTPPEEFHAASGPYKPAEVTKSVKACGSKCGKPPKTSQIAKATIFRWTDDPTELGLDKVNAAPVFDALGRAPIVVVRDGFAALTYEADAVTPAANGPSSPSMADVPSFRLAAESLRRRGVFAALLTDDAQVPQIDKPSGAAARSIVEPLAWETAGAGVAGDLAAPVLEAALVFASAGSAKTDADLLRKRFATEPDVLHDMDDWKTEFPSIEISVEDRTVVVSMRGPGVKQWGSEIVNGNLALFASYWK
jgi:hypothetical protein